MDLMQMPKGFQLVGEGASFKAEIRKMIADTRLFSDFDGTDIDTLSDYVQCYKVPSGTVVFKEGDAGSYMCLLISGQIEILKKDHTGSPKHLVMIAGGQTVGEMSIVDGEPRSATCIANQDSVALVLTKDHYERIIKERPLLAIHILARLAKLMSLRLRSSSGQLVEHLGQMH